MMCGCGYCLRRRYGSEPDPDFTWCERRWHCDCHVCRGVTLGQLPPDAKCVADDDDDDDDDPFAMDYLDESEQVMESYREDPEHGPYRGLI